MIVNLLALVCFIAAAILAAWQRAWVMALLAIGFVLLVLADLPIRIG